MLGCMSVGILADPISHPYIRFNQYGLTAFTIHAQRDQAIRDRVRGRCPRRRRVWPFPKRLCLREWSSMTDIFL